MNSSALSGNHLSYVVYFLSLLTNTIKFFGVCDPSRFTLVIITVYFLGNGKHDFCLQQLTNFPSITIKMIVISFFNSLGVCMLVVKTLLWQIELIRQLRVCSPVLQTAVLKCFSHTPQAGPLLQTGLLFLLLHLYQEIHQDP